MWKQIRSRSSEADQIVPTKDEQKLGARFLFANARLPWRADRGLPPRAAAGRGGLASACDRTG
jgi:hypothetical protein